MIEIKGIKKRFGDLELLRGVNLRVEKGETLVLIGPPGCGKSVLLKICAGLIEPDAGEILIDGKSITKARGRALDQIRSRMGMLFQNYALFDSMSVKENLALALRQLTDDSEERISERVKEALSWVKLKNVENLKTAELSGGMKKRVGIARAWVIRPDFMLYDEPTAGLDPVTSERINVLIKAFARDHKMSSIAVSQDMLTAFSIADKLAFLYEGEIKQVGTAEEMKNSSNPYVRQFLQGMMDGPIKMDQKVEEEEAA
ncbi:MAG: ATP-binding cassette domain-containing protein [Bdellovibrionota bacterium]